MEVRPKLIIEHTRVDKVLEASCFIILIILWTGTIAGFSKLPDLIPSHFNAGGQADDYCDRISIFTLPIVATVLYIGMTILNRYPHIYNYPARVTVDNARHLYTSATRLIRVLKLAVIVIFSGIVLMTYKTSLTDGYGLGTWFLPLAVGLMILPSFIYLIKSSNSKQISR